MTHLHILGVCGTFMGGIAALARELKFEVSGSDQNIYPPMSDQLAALGIALKQGYLAEHLKPHPDLVIVGNALSRGNAAVEYLLNQHLPYQSGPEWLGKTVLQQRDVIAVAGTHGKTTTTSMLAWILEQADLAPGFLVGGVPENFGVSARLGSGKHFVIEADEYDTAFFDKRSKFLHYQPRIALLNNLEFDHADIFDDLAAIQKQFHHLVRTVPSNGKIIVNAEEPALAEVLKKGCWTPVETFAIDLSVEADWRAKLISADGAYFSVTYKNQVIGEVQWNLLGRHNVMNALAAVAAAAAAGVDAKVALTALATFISPKRRLELIGEVHNITVFDDFAHHPTAIATTIAGLRAKVGKARLIVALEARSNSMRDGAHVAGLAQSLAQADQVFFLHKSDASWDARTTLAKLEQRLHLHLSADSLIAELGRQVQQGDYIVFMSNGSFEQAPRRFFNALQVSNFSPTI